MTRTATSSPLVERDVDGSLVPAGRQMAPRQDDRSSYGLTDVDEVIFQYAADEVNGHPTRIDQYVTLEEAKAMQALTPPLTSMEARGDWLKDHRASHPLPTSYSALPPGDPSLYVYTIAAAPIPPVPAAAIPTQPTTFIRTMPDPDAASPYSKPTVRVLTGPYIPPVAPPVTPPASTLTTVLDTATEIAAFAEAHPQAVTALLSVLRSLGGLFTHKAA